MYTYVYLYTFMINFRQLMKGLVNRKIILRLERKKNVEEKINLKSFS